MPAARNEENGASTTKLEENTNPSARTDGQYICLGLVTQEMPTATGYLDGHPVTVLRDSGCNTGRQAFDGTGKEFHQYHVYCLPSGRFI